MSFAKHKSDIFRMWTRQLQKEFEYLCWVHKVNLRTPIFEISPAKTRYGSWNPELGTIEISEALVRNYSWDVVINVLKHEMAHQVCAEIFHIPNAGHGEIYHRACDLIGLDPRFRSSSGDLPEGVMEIVAPDELSQESRRFIEKVRKLLALAQSENEHEANLAMAKAGELMDKYNLRQIAEDSRENYENVIINHGKKRLERYQRKIATILRDFFYVYIVFSRQYDPELDTEHKVIDIMGKKENVEVAEFVYYFLEQKIRSLWNENRSKLKGRGLRARNSYFYGLLQGFYDKLKKQNSRLQESCCKHSGSDTQTTSVLVVSSDTKLKSFVNKRYPRLGKYAASNVKIDFDIYAQGIVDGKDIVIYRGVHSKDGNNGYALEDA